MTLKKKTFVAKMELVPHMMDYIAEIVEKFPPKIAYDLTLVSEEILVNIASYAYPSDEGSLSILLEDDSEQKQFKLVFEDSGVPFNPLLMEEPDLTASIQDRKIGGLGIMMIRKLMDTVQYTYTDGKNILTITKGY